MGDGKLYVEEIRKCICREKEDGCYLLECKIHQRGCYSYSYRLNEDFISKRGFVEGKALYLSDDAKETVLKSVSDFEEEVEKTRKWKHIKVPCQESFICIYYRIAEDGEFEYFLEHADSDKKHYKGKGVLHRVLFDAAIMRHGWKAYKRNDLFVSSAKDAIDRNLFYQAALEQKDELFAKLLKVYLGADDIEDCTFLSDCLGYRVLPSLSGESDKEYFIEADGVDYDLLYHSGYKILHRPNFGMKGSTRFKITLNPHAKRGVDAAPVSSEAISFQEFLKLFDC